MSHLYPIQKAWMTCRGSGWALAALTWDLVVDFAKNPEPAK